MSEKNSPKSKSARNVPEDWVTTWIDLNMPPERAEVLQRAAKQRNVNLPTMLSAMVEGAVQANWASLQMDAANYKGKDAAMTSVQRDKKIKRLQAQLQRLNQVSFVMTDSTGTPIDGRNKDA